MKHFFTFILLIGFSVQLFGQSHVKQIKADLEQMHQYVQDNETEKVLELTYPKIFEIMPKEQMKAMISNDGMETALGMKIKDTKYGDVKMSKRQKVGQGKLVLVSYFSEMTVDLDDEMKKVVELASKMGNEVNIPQFVKTENGDYKLKGKSYSAVIQDEHTKGKWNYLNVNFNKSGKIELPDNVLTQEYKRAFEKLYLEIKE